MIYLTAQPDRIKFYWQLVIQLRNFKEMGIDLNNVHILVGVDGLRPSDEMRSLQSTGAQVFFYPYRSDYTYVSSVRPHILKQHFYCYPELSDQYIFYLDSDVVFNRLPDYRELTLDGRWYVSDTRNYLSAQYILRDGGPELFLDMCAVVGIDPFFVKSRDYYVGGAQYIMKGTTSQFWEKVERDCIKLYQIYSQNREKYQALGEKDIQLWCSDMWAVLWNAWLFRKQTFPSSELTFAWGHGCMEDNKQRVMLHLSGVTERTQKNKWAPHFDKFLFDKEVPFAKVLPVVNPQSASYKYVQYIEAITQEMACNSPQL
jgi:hypothetical protein